MSTDFNVPIRAKIVSVLNQSSDGMQNDTIVVEFTVGDKQVQKDFRSPILDEKSMAMWRRITGSVCLDQKLDIEDERVRHFNRYKMALENCEVYIAYDGKEVYAIGKNSRQLFFPYEYGLGANK